MSAQDIRFFIGKYLATGKVEGVDVRRIKEAINELTSIELDLLVQAYIYYYGS